MKREVTYVEIFHVSNLTADSVKLLQGAAHMGAILSNIQVIDSWLLKLP